MSAQTVLSVSDLGFRYNAADVLQEITFDVSAGDYVGLVGHNGSGKTTLIKVILGLLKPYVGDVWLFGRPLARFTEWSRIGYMPQNLSLFNPIFPATVEEVVSLGLLSRKRFPKRITGRDKKTVRDALERLGMSDMKDRLIGHLSGGQQQRVFLARALITGPDLLILDEPSNALDAYTREQFFSILEGLNKERETAIILITHDAVQVGKYARKLLSLDRKVLFYGSFADFSASETMGQPFGRDTQDLIGHRHERS